MRTKALRMHDWKVLNKLTVGDLVANELKYHAMCLVIFQYLQQSHRRGVGND